MKHLEFKTISWFFSLLLALASITLVIVFSQTAFADSIGEENSLDVTYSATSCLDTGDVNTNADTQEVIPITNTSGGISDTHKTTSSSEGDLGISLIEENTLENITQSQLLDTQVVLEGWQHIDGYSYYYENGIPIKGSRYIDGYWYRFDLADGHMLTGDQIIDGKEYRFDATTGRMLLGTQNIDGKWYCYDFYGGFKLYGSQCIYGKWYRYDLADGHMLFGSQYFDGHWYRYDPYGGFLLFGSQNIDGGWYWYDLVGGFMHFGATSIYGNMYWYDRVSGKMLFGWQNIYGIMTFYDLVAGYQRISSNTAYNTYLMVQNFTSPTNYLITIDNPNCLVTVFYGSQGNWMPLYHWLCSPGTAATPTVKGFYSVGSRGFVFGSGYSCYWWTQIYGDYLIHSVLYYPGTNTIMEGTMGVPASQGCVRLDIQNAKLIYDTVPTGSTIYSF